MARTNRKPRITPAHAPASPHHHSKNLCEQRAARIPLQLDGFAQARVIYSRLTGSPEEPAWTSRNVFGKK
jgi:hypothetical protein